MNKDKSGAVSSSKIAGYINEFRKKNAKAFYALVIALALMLTSGCVAATSNGDDTGSSKPQTEQISSGVLSFMVESEQWDTATDGSIAVAVKGKTMDGEQISRQFNAIPGEKCNTGIPAGSYELSLVDGKANKGNKLFTAAAVTAVFGKEESYSATLHMKLDSTKMEQLEKEAAAKKAEEERIAKEKAEAEKQAKAKEEAAKNSAANKSTTQNSSSQSSSKQKEATVYIASSGNGKKYHSNPSCSRMKGTISLTVSEAKSRGYSACKKCY